MKEHLFVYGTLGPNKPNSHVLEKIGGTWTNGSVRGFLKAAGWGAEMGFPGLLLNENGNTIEGHIFSSDNLNQSWESLDEFEGKEYQRILADVVLEDGRIQQAYVYALNDVDESL